MEDKKLSDNTKWLRDVLNGLDMSDGPARSMNSLRHFLRKLGIQSAAGHWVGIIVGPDGKVREGQI